MPINDTSVVTRIKVAVVQAGAVLEHPAEGRRRAWLQSSPAWLYLPSLGLLLICLPRAGGLLLIWKKELFVLTATRIKYVMTLLFSQGLLLFSPRNSAHFKLSCITPLILTLKIALGDTYV